MADPLRLLVVEDSESDAALVVRLFSKAGYQVTSHRVETRATMADALATAEWDCVIADHNMPEFDAFAALETLQSSGLDIPFIVVSGSIGEEAAVALMKAGAADYVMKGKLAKLTLVVAREMRDAAARRERRAAIDALRANEEHFRRLYEFAPLAYQSLDPQGNILEVNRVWLDTLGYTRDEVIGRPFADLLNQEGLETLAERFPRFHQDGQVSGVEYTMRRKDGSQIRVAFEGKIGLDEFGGFKQTHCIFTDITERRHAEEALRASEEKYRRLYELESDALFLIEKETGRILEANPGATELYGYSHGEWLTMRNVDVSVEPERTTAATHDGTTDIPIRWHRKKDGTVFPVDIRATHFDWQGRPVHLAAIRDVTERVRAQEALRTERDRAASYLQIAGVVLLALDADGKVTLINRRGCELLGYTQDELLGRDWFETCAPAENQQANRAVYSGILAGQLELLAEYQNQVVTRSGERRLIAWRNSILRDSEGHPLGMLSSGENITERERAVEALRQRNFFVENLLERAPIGFAVNTIHDGKPVYVSRNFERIYGLEPDSVTGTAEFFENVYLDPTFREQMRDRIMSDMATGDPARMRWEDIPIITRTGEHKVVTAINIPLFEQDQMISTVQDVTERKRAEEALRETERELVNAQRLTGIGSWSYDPVTQQPKWSEGMFLIWDLDPKLGAPSYAEHRKIIHPDDFPRFDAAVQAAVEHGMPYNLELRIRRSDGGMGTIITICEPQLDGSGKVVGLRGTSQDITERKHAEDTIRASLREKEILLREIHHRVKNNLQVIASLLTLQAHSLTDPGARDALRDSQNRIRAISLIHAKLYESRDLARVDFGAFVRDLGTILVRAYAENPGAIHLKVSAGQAELDADTLVPCSLIINELLTNAIKHAFPPKAGGTITVEFSEQEESFTLRVADDGIGFPDTVDFRNTKSLGLRLVVMLVEQLDGTVDMVSEGGTAFTIRFRREAGN